MENTREADVKIEHLLLGVLLERPGTGYDLKKFMDTHGRFLRSNTQMSQVYRSLAAMTDRGWVTFTAEHRPGAQDAKVYRVTEDGAAVFLDWLTGPYHPPTRFEDPEFGARLAFAGFMDVDQLVGLLTTEIEARQAQVTRYRNRDRRIDFHPDAPFDTALAEAVGQRMHEIGAAAIDRHIRQLLDLRRDLLGGRLQSAAGPAPTPEHDRHPDQHPDQHPDPHPAHDREDAHR